MGGRRELGRQVQLGADSESEFTLVFLRGVRERDQEETRLAVGQKGRAGPRDTREAGPQEETLDVF